MILNLSDILSHSILIPGKDLPVISKEELHEKGIEELMKYLKEEFRNPVISCTPIQGTHELQKNPKNESKKENKKGEIL